MFSGDTSYVTAKFPAIFWCLVLVCWDTHLTRVPGKRKDTEGCDGHSPFGASKSTDVFFSIEKPSSSFPTTPEFLSGLWSSNMAGAGKSWKAGSMIFPSIETRILGAERFWNPEIMEETPGNILEKQLTNKGFPRHVWWPLRRTGGQRSDCRAGAGGRFRRALCGCHPQSSSSQLLGLDGQNLWRCASDDWGNQNPTSYDLRYRLGPRVLTKIAIYGHILSYTHWTFFWFSTIFLWSRGKLWNRRPQKVDAHLMHWSINKRGYDVLPVTLNLGLGFAKTSLLVPPLLALAYALLGSLLPQLLEAIGGTEAVGRLPLLRPQPVLRAVLAVASTCFIIKISELLVTSDGPSALLLLSLLALFQWAALDGRRSSLTLALLAGLLGPLAELPLISLGAWHYTQPDYWPLTWLGLGPGTWAALSMVTGPCYFAVTTDAIALGRLFAGKLWSNWRSERCERSETEFTSENTKDTKDVRSARWIRSHVISRCFTRHSLDSWRLARCRSEEVAMNDLPSLNERTTWLQKPRGGFSTHTVWNVFLCWFQVPNLSTHRNLESGSNHHSVLSGLPGACVPKECTETLSSASAFGRSSGWRTSHGKPSLPPSLSLSPSPFPSLSLSLSLCVSFSVSFSFAYAFALSFAFFFSLSLSLCCFHLSQAVW